MAREACVPMMKTEKIGGRDKWEVENDLRALRDASKIKREPGRLSAVKTLIKQEISALEAIADKKMDGLGKDV